MLSNNKQKSYLALGLVILAVISRFIPHPANFTPLMAMSIFAGILFTDKRFAFIIPILAMILTDIVLGLHSAIPFVYISLLLGVFSGFVLKKNLKFSRVFTFSVANSIQFFIITNFGFWLTGGFYPLSLSGLMEAYFMGLPFLSHSSIGLFGWTLAGDLTFNISFFGVILFADKLLPKPVKI